MDDANLTSAVERSLQSCAECRRRKAKCDRSTPCSNCARAGRTCSYGTISRTPLTRKHLTSVEEELARAKALLRQFQRKHSTPAPDVPESSNQATDENLSSPVFGQFQPTTPLNVVEVQASFEQSQPTSPPATFEHPVTVRNHESRSTSPPFSMETSPARADFDWDERVLANRQSQFIDGMASLTESTNRGYMGAASGAAMIRLTNDTEEPGTEVGYSRNDDDRAQAITISHTLYAPSQLEPFIDEYFRTYHISYPIVHEATFRAQFMEIIPKPTDKAWQALLHIIAALGAFGSSVTTPQVDEGLFDAAKARLSIDMLETGTLTLVQALTLISNYVQKRNRPNSGYNYLGLAKRMAMSIGLHKEFSDWRSRPLWLETRRRVYWCLYIFDVGATITFSRPLDNPHDGIEIGLPLNVADSDITVNTEKFPPEVQDITLYTHVRCQSQFHLATSVIYATLISPPLPSAKEMLQADDVHLVKWLQRLPSYFREGAIVPTRYRLCHSVMQWRWRNFRILMYRPFLMRKFMKKTRKSAATTSTSNSSITTNSASTSSDEAIQRCLDAAAQSIRMIATFWQTETQNVLSCWYSLYFLFQATLIPVIGLRNEPNSSSAAEYHNLVTLALQTISDMGRINSTASRCHMVIMKLCAPYLTQDISQWNSPTGESPFTQLNALNSLMWPITDPQVSMPSDFGLLEFMPMDFFNDFPE